MADRGARFFAAAGLAVDAYVHADLASRYDAVQTSTVSQGDLFRVEAGVAALVALLIVVVARPAVYAAAAAVAASALGAVLLYRYVNVGILGPLPDMYEPIWFTEKVVTAVAEAVALAGALAGLGNWVVARRAPRSGAPASASARPTVR